MSFDPESFTFGVDLTKQAVYQIDFLGMVNKIPELKLPHTLARSVYRYEKYWLPLAAAYPQECLSAPLDIEWVWHCHMLSPRAYAKDCQNIVNTVVNHTLKDKKDFQMSQTKSRDIWYKLYGEENEPFTLDFNAPYDEHAISNFESKISYDIIEAASRQKEFYYQVSLPHYKDTKFLDGGLVRYKKFLYLKQQLPDEFIVPCYDIDLLWHTHQLNPWAYKHDMMKYIGNLFNHDDNVGGRGKGSKLYNADLNTRKHWKEIFAERFSLYGAMYRGCPSENVFYQLSENDIETFIAWKTNFHPEEMYLQRSGDRLPSRFKLNVYGNDGSKHGKRCKLICFKKPSRSVKCHSEILWSRKEMVKSGAFVFDTRHYNHITFDLQESFGIACCADYESIGEFSYEVKPEIENSGGTGRFDIAAPLSRNVTLNIGGTYSPIRGPAVLYLDEGKFKSASITDVIHHGSTTVAFENIPPGGGNNCKVATHRLKNHVGSVVFTCRTIHSAQLMQSIIQVFYHDKMAAIGQLIGSDQLPLPTQVKDDVISLNPRIGERAMLIRNNQGDWGIVVGKWKFFEVGKAGTPGRHGKRGCPGKFHVSFYKLTVAKLKKTTRYLYGYSQDSYSPQIESANIDLMKGVVEIDPTSNEVAENLALAFSISVLHVLCVPRPSKWKEGQSVMKPAVKKRGGYTVEMIPSDNMKFITAAGLLISSPSNYYVRSNHGMTAFAMCGGGGRSNDFIADFSSEGDDLKTYADSGACMDHARGEPGNGGGGCGGCGGGYTSVYLYTPSSYRPYHSRSYRGGGYGGGGGGDYGGCDGGCGGGCGGGGCGGC